MDPTNSRNLKEELKDHAIIDSGCSGSMTGDKDKLSDFKDYKGGYVAFGNDPKGGRITGKGTIKTSCIDFENVSYVKELKFNLLSVSQICDKKHNVLFTDTECLILSPEFKIVDENLVLLRAPRKNDVYSLNLKSIIPSGGVTCLVAKASEDEAILWHRRLGHVNFKNINKLVKSNLVRGLPSKTFKHDHSCLACRKGKQHKASCKKLEEKTVREPLELLHMDLFGPVSVESLNRKKYCLVVTDDCSRFSWVFFLVYKDETYDILHDLIVGLENKLRRKVKTIRCDHGTEFKNKLMNEFCAKKGIQREYSIARTPQQNGVAERKNRTLIEAARTMLADSLLPIQFWAEAVHTACYVLNRVLVTKPQMKTPYELLMGKPPNISFMKPFGCPLTILNTMDHLGKFEGKSEEGYLLGYSTNSKGFRVYNRVTRKVQDCLHVDFLEDQMNQKEKGPDWMFDLDILSPSMNYIPFIVHGSNSIGNKAVSGATINDAQNKDSDEKIIAHTHMENQGIASEKRKEKGKEIYDLSESDDDLPKDGIFHGNSFDDENKDTEEEIDLDLNNMDNTMMFQINWSLLASGVKTRKQLQEEPKKITQALQDESWVEAMQEELLQFKLQNIWVLCDLPDGKRVIRTKWVFRNKRDERVARIEAISLFLGLCIFMGFSFIKWIVKKCILYGNIIGRGLCNQPPGFVDPQSSKPKVYKGNQGIIWITSSSRAWYAKAFHSFSLKTCYRKVAFDKVLLFKRDRKKDIMLVQVYVDDIILDSTKISMGYQLSLESLEVIIRTHEKNEYAWGDKYEQMEYDLKMRDWKLGEKQKEFDNVIKERDELKEKLEKWSNATLLQTEILNKQKVLSDKTCIGFGVEYSSSEESNNSSGDETLTGPLYENFKREKAYKAVPPPTGTIIPPRADVAFTGIDELAIRNKVINKQNSESSGTDHESCESKNRDDLIKNKEQTQNTVKSNTDRNKVIIEDWVDSDDEEVPLGFSEIKKQTVLKSETSSENKSPKSKDSFGQRSRRRGLGCRDGKVCFVCYSPDHLIKDCDLHERNLKKTQKPKPLETKGSRDSRSVWNNTSRVNHRNFSSDYRHPHQRRSFIPLGVLTREGLKSTVRSKMSQAVPSQSTAKTSMVKEFEELMQKEFKMSSIGELTFFLGLQVKQSTAGIFISQDKYVKDILNKFDFRTIKPATTPIEAHKALGKDEEGEDVDVHLYRSMIGCLMYLTASRPNIISLSDSDYAGDNHDRRSTSGGCQYLRRRLVSWQCKKQTIVAISYTEAEYVAAASYNESTICIVKNPVFHSKTKHIQIRHHFIRDCYDQRLINVVKVHTDDNVADLLTKGFDLARFNSLVVNIGMMNP
ncbi:putative ribonuclease H-like domain-containing protein [Tanacetum coccineum]